MTVEPTSIHGSFESLEGVDIESFAETEIFRKLIKLTNKLRQEFDIHDIIRSGFRFYYLDNLADSPEKVNKAFTKIINDKLSGGLESTVGTIKDSGFSFDGEHNDKIKYHFRCGPYFRGEAGKYFKYISQKIDESSVKDLIVDLDCYEEKFNLSRDVSFKKWCNPILSKANSTFNIINELMKELIED